MTVNELIEELQKLKEAGQVKPDYELLGQNEDGKVYEFYSLTVKNESIFFELSEVDD